jgi:chromosomal replication initiator protein
MTESDPTAQPNASARSIWEAALGRLQVQVTKPNYDTWLKDTVGIACDEYVFVVGAPSDFAIEWLNTRLRPLVAKALANVVGMDLELTFQVIGASDQERPQTTDATALADAARPAPARLPEARLNSAFTFAAFVVGDCNRLAHAAAMAMAPGPSSPYNPLFIWGPVGLGKTHLLHAISHEALKSAPGVLLASAEKFTNDFVRALKEKRTESFRNRYRSADILLVDDIQFLVGKEQTQEEFFHTFNELQAAGKRIAMTCDRSPQELTGLDTRLRSRFQSGLVADISTPAVDTRAAILRAKAAAHGASISPEVIDLLARRTPGSVRDLEGSLNRVAAYARLTHQPLTLDLAAHAVDPLPSRNPPSAPSPNTIVTAVSAYFHVSPDALASRSRAKDLTYARHIAMYLLREDAHCSLTDIGRIMGGRDHATALYAYSRIGREIPLIPQTEHDITNLRSQLGRAAA